MIRTAPAKCARELVSRIKNLNTTPNRIGFYQSYISSIFSALHFIKTPKSN